ncbi:hypothetical protein [Pseudopedobacter sp.]|uniref:hypothetical protein n=1 Tax=Pseudopedobacter sp. TaxID=1936787 RepID=UPI00333F4BC8
MPLFLIFGQVSIIMAVIDNRGRLHGKIGNHVYRTVGDIHIVQAKPGRVRQTLSTKESALEFGLVSNCGRILRELYSSFTCYSDGRLLNRMNAALLKCLRDTDKPRGERDLHDGNPEHLDGLQFNVNSPLTEMLPVRPKCSMEDGVIRVHLPSFQSRQLQQPRYSKYAVLRLMIVAISFRDGYYEYLDYKDIEVKQGTLVSEQEWISEVELPAGSLVLVSASLHYFGMQDVNGERLALNSLDCSPAEIIGTYKIVEKEQNEPPAEVSITSDSHPERHRLINYRGKEILDEIARKRKRDKKYQASLVRTKPQKVENENVSLGMKPLIKGKILYKKE